MKKGKTNESECLCLSLHDSIILGSRPPLPNTYQYLSFNPTFLFAELVNGFAHPFIIVNSIFLYIGTNTSVFDFYISNVQSLIIYCKTWEKIVKSNIIVPST